MKTEDYVSYELAVKLKEKGFDWECHSFYLPPNKSRKDEFFSGYQTRVIRNATHAFHYAAPTLSQAQKWLREEKYIVVSVEPDWDEEVQCLSDYLTGKWYFTIWKENSRIRCNFDPSKDGEEIWIFEKYEQALSAGITKALELI